MHDSSVVVFMSCAFITVQDIKLLERFSHYLKGEILVKNERGACFSRKSHLLLIKNL